MANPNIEVTTTVTSQFVDASMWIPMEMDQPKNLQTVFVVVKSIDSDFRCVCKAQYTDGYGMPVDDELWDGGFGVYHEEDDEYYAPKGFYQFGHLHEEVHFQIPEDEYNITHWMPVPKMPNHA